MHHYWTPVGTFYDSFFCPFFLPRAQFESGFERGGQTMEHTVLVRSLGVQQLIVAVNKMDNVDYSQDRWEDATFE